jgi:hypothetical protein
MKTGRAVPLLVLLVATCGASGSARHDADVLVAVGAGVAGTWETEFDFANPDASNAVNVFAGEQPHPFVCVTAPCGIAYAPLPRSGTARIVTRSAEFGRFTGRLFVGADDAEDLPTVKARVVNRARPTQTIELPLYRRSTLVALNPLVLSFPDARRAAGIHTNLFVSEVGTTAGISVRIEAFSAAGDLLGTEALALAPGETLFLQDVLARMNVAEILDGQIRVTRTGGAGVLWGLAATVFDDDGRVTVTPGKHP